MIRKSPHFAHTTRYDSRKRSTA